MANSEILEKDTDNNLPFCAIAMPRFQHPCSPDGIWTSDGLITWIDHLDTSCWGAHKGSRELHRARNSNLFKSYPPSTAAERQPQAPLKVMMDTH